MWNLSLYQPSLFIWMISCCHPTLCQFLCSVQCTEGTITLNYIPLHPETLKIRCFSKRQYVTATAPPWRDVLAFTLNSWIHLPDPEDCKNARPDSSLWQYLKVFLNAVKCNKAAAYRGKKPNCKTKLSLDFHQVKQQETDAKFKFRVPAEVWAVRHTCLHSLVLLGRTAKNYTYSWLHICLNCSWFSEKAICACKRGKLDPK